VFDLDGTLYAIANGYEAACRRRVFDYMVRTCPNVATVDDAREIWARWFKKYNQTLRALRRGAGYEIDEDEYWRVTRGDAREHLAPSEDVRAFVESLPGGRENKYVFTNCHETQAREALDALGLRDCFGDRVFGARGMGRECCKPEPEAFEKFFAAFGIAREDRSKCVFFEDSLKNLRAAKAFGWTTVLVAGETFREETRERDGDCADVADVAPAFVDLVVHGGTLTERAVEDALSEANASDALRGAFGARPRAA
jgi:pyrimidine 5'-nucleotidase